MKLLKSMKVALVYDRVNKWGGAERVLLQLNRIFPHAPLYTSVYNEKKASWAKVFPKIITSFIQRIPIIKDIHEIVGWLTPIAFEQFDFKQFDLVISVTSEAAKGIITDTKTKHVCYCLTPTRYLWSGYEEYIKSPQWPLNFIPFYKYLAKPFLSYTKIWDLNASARPDLFIAISKEVQKRINIYYKRDSFLVYPAIKMPEKFIWKIPSLKNYYLLVSRLVPYKKVDLAIKVFNKLNEHLVVVGEGSEFNKLKNISKKNIHFIKNLNDEDLFGWYKYAKALIVPQKEDFGLVCLEAQIMGTPVVVFKESGAAETVIEGKTGITFNHQSVKDLKKAVIKIKNMKFDKNILINNAKRFSGDVFKTQLLDIINKQL